LNYTRKPRSESAAKSNEEAIPGLNHATKLAWETIGGHCQR